ncbi:hypothetical protein [Flavicella sp.]|uniref:hypothetical protein n=1 Tax=Flavicella sp. TaxID=2957742 RepID=UPI00301B029A
MTYSFSLIAQRHIRSEVHFNKASVYVGEPIEVSLSIYSSTWFTEGVNPGNIKINGAYTVYFRSLSTSKKFDNRLYSGVTFFFNVFPYNEEDVEFPSLEFIVETPNEGGYVGIKRKVKTRAKTIVVKPIPPGINKDSWMVSSSVRVYDSWKGDLSKVKVGDVLERNITIKVGGTISELITDIEWDTINNVSLYPKRSSLKNNKSKMAISAERVDGTRYLFEKEGEITIPEIVITWWNPRYSKMYKRVLKKRVINVETNPDLGMLETVRKNLENTVVTELDKKFKFEIFGRSLKTFLSFFIVCLIGVFLVFKIGKWSFIKARINRELYRKSEAYFFQLFVKERDIKLKQQRLYKWIDQLNLEEPSLACFIGEFGTDLLVLNYKKNLVNSRNTNFIHQFNKEWKLSRENFLKTEKNYKDENSDWVNP